MNEPNVVPRNSGQLSAGDKVLVGRSVIEVDEEFAAGLSAGDVVLGVGATGTLRRLPRDVVDMVDAAVGRARAAFSAMSAVDGQRITDFFDIAARRLGDDAIFAAVSGANDDDVRRARERGRSTTRLALGNKMRSDMVTAMRMWRDTGEGAASFTHRIDHEGWSVEQWNAPLGVVGFVFEGRPNVFADATGVLRSRNTVVFRIGSDALQTARALMDGVINPAITEAGLPAGCVALVDSPEHAAGWALFSDPRLALAVARGSGPAVEELGSIAQQSGIPVSLHGTGGAWMIVGESADPGRLARVVENSLDRKVCNTLNVVCVPRSVARELVPVLFDAATRAAAARGTEPRVHAVGDAVDLLPVGRSIVVRRASGVSEEPQVSVGTTEGLGHEFEWEENPEFHLVLVDTMDEAVRLFNEHSPRFIASIVTADPDEEEAAWMGLDAPFVGDGFTRWVDGQFALLRPELGLSNWSNGRLFARGGILSGDSVHTVRLRVHQTDPDVHR